MRENPNPSHESGTNSRRPASYALWPIVLLIIAGSLGTVLIVHRLPDSAKQQPERESSGTGTGTIERSGEILGIRIGSTLEEARAKLDPLRDLTTDTITEKKEPGRRKTYWKLAHPEYSWIMVRPNREGRITQISLFIKPETAKPFDQIGDPKHAATNLENMAVWNINQPNNLSYRLVAKGTNGRATNVILIALE